MKTFRVYRQKGSAIDIEAWAYTEDTATDRVYFHKREDKSDRECFVVLSHIDSIDTPEGLKPEPFEEMLKRVQSSPEAMRALASISESTGDREERPSKAKV